MHFEIALSSWQKPTRICKNKSAIFVGLVFTLCIFSPRFSTWGPISNKWILSARKGRSFPRGSCWALCYGMGEGQTLLQISFSHSERPGLLSNFPRKFKVGTTLFFGIPLIAWGKVIWRRFLWVMKQASKKPNGIKNHYSKPRILSSNYCQHKLSHAHFIAAWGKSLSWRKYAGKELCIQWEVCFV